MQAYLRAWYFVHLFISRHHLLTVAMLNTITAACSRIFSYMNSYMQRSTYLSSSVHGAYAATLYTRIIYCFVILYQEIYGRREIWRLNHPGMHEIGRWKSGLAVKFQHALLIEVLTWCLIWIKDGGTKRNTFWKIEYS